MRASFDGKITKRWIVSREPLYTMNHWSWKNDNDADILADTKKVFQTDNTYLSFVPNIVL